MVYLTGGTKMKEMMEFLMSMIPERVVLLMIMNVERHFSLLYYSNKPNLT